MTIKYATFTVSLTLSFLDEGVTPAVLGMSLTIGLPVVIIGVLRVLLIFAGKQKAIA